MIRWYSYYLKSEQLNLCIGSDFLFQFEMLVILVMLFLSLSSMNKVTKFISWFAAFSL